MNQTTEKLLDLVENIKEKITDNEYKNIVETLNIFHKEKGVTKEVYRFETNLKTIKQKPYIYKCIKNCEYNNCGMCKSHGKERYILYFDDCMLDEVLEIDTDTDFYRFLVKHKDIVFYNAHELYKILDECINDDGYDKMPSCIESFILPKIDGDDDDDADYVCGGIIIKNGADSFIKGKCLSKSLFYSFKFEKI